MAAVLQPCDAGVIQGTKPLAPCKPSSRPWVIAAASIGSGLAFLDSAVLNVTLPAVQNDLGANAQDVQWIYGAYALVLAALMLVEEVSWRAAFLISPVLVVAAIVISLRHVPESRDPQARGLDLTGAALATLGLAGLVYGLIESSSSGLGDPRVLAALALGATSLAAFASPSGAAKILWCRLRSSAPATSTGRTS